MSERSEVPAPEGEYFETNRFGGLSFLCALVGFVALVLCVIGAFVEPRQFSFSWLFAFAFFFTLCAGCFLLDDRPSRHRCGMVRGRAAPVGEHRHPSGCHGGVLYPGAAASTSSL